MPLPASVTVDALKRRVDKALGKDDDLLTEFLEMAVEQAGAPSPLGCGRNLFPEPALVPGEEESDPAEDTAKPIEKHFEVRGRRLILPDAREIATVVVDGDERDSTQYKLLRKNGLAVLLTLAHEHWCGAYGYDGWGGRGSGRCGCANQRNHTVEVTGRFGFLEIPTTLREAIYIYAARAWYEREAQYADQVPIGEGAAGIQVYFRQIPPRAKIAFETYALPSGIGGLA